MSERRGDAAPRVPRSVRATIEYRASAGAPPGLRGREWMAITRYADGSAMYRSQSENDQKGLVREVLMRLDAAWRPLECFFVLRVAGAYEGSMHYRFGPGFASAEGWNRAQGAVRRHLTLEGTPAGFCPHPISSDALLLAAYDRRLGGPQRPALLFMSSVDAFGATGPDLHPISATIEFAGETSIATPAGSLPADRYVLPIGEGAAALRESIWCLAGTPIFLHAEIEGASYPTQFVLTALELQP